MDEAGYGRGKEGCSVPLNFVTPQIPLAKPGGE